MSVADARGYRLRQSCLACRMASPCPDHSLAHAACPCYDQDDEFQYNGGDAQSAESWTAMTPPKKRLSYLVPNPSPDRHVSLSVQKYMHKTTGMCVLHRCCMFIQHSRAANTLTWQSFVQQSDACRCTCKEHSELQCNALEASWSYSASCACGNAMHVVLMCAPYKFLVL